MDIAARHFLYPANLLSLLRLALAAPITWLVAHPEAGRDGLLLALIGAAILSDMLDGYASRKLGQVSDLGKVLDPVADKVIIVGGIGAAVFARGFPALVVFLQAYRDVMILLAAALIAGRKQVVVSASPWGKLSTFVMSLLCLVYLWRPDGMEARLLMFAALLTIFISGVDYYRRGERLLVDRSGSRWLARAAVGLAPVALAWLAWKAFPHLYWV